MTRLLIACTAPTWGPTNSQHMNQSRRNQIGATLKLVADRLMQRQLDGTFLGLELETVFRLDVDETADAA